MLQLQQQHLNWQQQNSSKNNFTCSTTTLNHHHSNTILQHIDNNEEGHHHHHRVLYHHNHNHNHKKTRHDSGIAMAPPGISPRRRHANHHSNNVLPMEVLCLICSLLADDPATLAAASTVSRRWSAAGIPQLWASPPSSALDRILEPFIMEHDQLEDAMLSRPYAPLMPHLSVGHTARIPLPSRPYAPLMRHLSVGPTARVHAIPLLFPNALTANLRAITLSHIHTVPLTVIHSLMKVTAHSLESLHIAGIVSEPHVLCMASARNIRHLRVSCWRVGVAAGCEVVKEVLMAEGVVPILSPSGLFRFISHLKAIKTLDIEGVGDQESWNNAAPMIQRINWQDLQQISVHLCTIRTSLIAYILRSNNPPRSLTTINIGNLDTLLPRSPSTLNDATTEASDIITIALHASKVRDLCLNAINERNTIHLATTFYARSLRSLKLSNVDDTLTDPVFRALVDCRNLSTLRLVFSAHTSCALTSHAIADVVSSLTKLTDVGLVGRAAPIDATLTSSLRSLPLLRDLCLSGTRLNGIEDVLRHSWRCESFSLSFCDLMWGTGARTCTIRDVVGFVQMCSRMRLLDLGRCEGLNLGCVGETASARHGDGDGSLALSVLGCDVLVG